MKKKCAVALRCSGRPPTAVERGILPRGLLLIGHRSIRVCSSLFVVRKCHHFGTVLAPFSTIRFPYSRRSNHLQFPFLETVTFRRPANGIGEASSASPSLASLRASNFVILSFLGISHSSFQNGIFRDETGARTRSSFRNSRNICGPVPFCKSRVLPRMWTRRLCNLGLPDAVCLLQTNDLSHVRSGS
jgi:hypothetical protein